MSNLSKFEFVALDISGKNYLSWVLDAEIHLAAKGLDATITQGNEASSQDKAKAMIFLRHHLDEGLKIEYLTQHNALLMKNHEAHPTGAAPLPEANVVGARDQSEVKEMIIAAIIMHGDVANIRDDTLIVKKGNKSGASSSNARDESHMTLKDDDKPGTSQKFDKDVEANLPLKDDVFDGLGDITHMEVDDFFGDRN
ncbi:uncharacterized protein LOC107016930 [Solanum pennellii]|uniref:Uncharacterized protein LOC107016930 n=1 Tax=Solanum pennellii TaxID=28526 RepID=A0ABM1GL77_SOLPN|nr:uncharacterized protein LOC107016930 [Solanum pennellii]